MSKIIRRGWERLSDVALFVLSAALPVSGQRGSVQLGSAGSFTRKDSSEAFTVTPGPSA
jgi:hypothetical protein